MVLIKHSTNEDIAFQVIDIHVIVNVFFAIIQFQYFETHVYLIQLVIVLAKPFLFYPLLFAYKGLYKHNAIGNYHQVHPDH